MSEPKIENPPDVVQEAPLTPSSDEADGASASTSPVSSPTAGKSDNYFSRKFGSILNRSKRKFKKNGSQDTVDVEHQNGHDNGEKSPTQKSPQKSPKSPQKSPKTPKTPQTPDNRQSKFQKLFRSSKRSKSADMVEDEAASTSQIGTGDISEAAKEKHANFTKYGQQRHIVVDGKALKEVEVTGEKQQESIPETRRHRRISKSRRKAEFEGDELKVQCRDLAPADYEGWLFKKSGGTGLTPVVWKQCWVVLKNGILYLFKTSFDIAAQHAYSVRNFSVAAIEEKRKFTFKLFPKNVPPEALHDAKGVVFSSESTADVEKWCDVLNKAALGFIIQPAIPAEQVEPVRRRCQSSAVKKNKGSVLAVTSNENGNRIRSSTFTGETTGLPSTFSRTSSTSRVRKVSQSGSSSVLAVGTMFRAIDEPEDKGEATNGDLSSILYKENQLTDESQATAIAPRSPLNGPTEEEVRMQVKKEVERINKQAKPVKVVEGSSGTTASTKKADIIRLEIQNLKESQRLMDKGDGESDVDMQMDEATKEEEAGDKMLEDGGEVCEDVTKDDGEVCEDADKEEHNVKAVAATSEEINSEGTDAVRENESSSRLDDAGKDENVESPDVGKDESITGTTSPDDKGIGEQGKHDAEVCPAAKEAEMQNVNSQTDIDEGSEKDGDEGQENVSSDTTSSVNITVMDAAEVDGDAVGKTVEEYLREVETSGSDVAGEEEQEEGGMTVEEYLRRQEQSEGETSVEDYLKAFSEESGNESTEKHASVDHGESASVDRGENASVDNGETVSVDNGKTVSVDNGKTASVDHGETVSVDRGEIASVDNGKCKDDGPKDDSVEPKIESVSHSSLIPAKQQRMLIDAVASLDYPSDTESESDADEICHYAHIERPSTPEAEIEASGKEAGDSHLDIVLGAPPEFQDNDSKHHSLSRVRDHNVQYGATEEERFIVHHTYIRDTASEDAKESQDEASAIIDNQTQAVDGKSVSEKTTLDSADPFTVYCEDQDTAVEQVLPINSEDELANFEERLNKLIEEEEKILNDLEKDEKDANVSDHVDLVNEHEADDGLKEEQRSNAEEEDSKDKNESNQNLTSADETNQIAATASVVVAMQTEKDSAEETEESNNSEQVKSTEAKQVTVEEKTSIERHDAVAIGEDQSKEEMNTQAPVANNENSDKDIENNNIEDDEKNISQTTTKTIKIIKVAAKDSTNEALEVRHESAV